MQKQISISACGPGVLELVSVSACGPGVPKQISVSACGPGVPKQISVSACGPGVPSDIYCLVEGDPGCCEVGGKFSLALPLGAMNDPGIGGNDGAASASAAAPMEQVDQLVRQRAGAGLQQCIWEAAEDIRAGSRCSRAAGYTDQVGGLGKSLEAGAVAAGHARGGTKDMA